MLTVMSLIVTIVTIAAGLVLLAAYGCCVAAGRADDERERAYERAVLEQWQADHDARERDGVA